MSKQARVWTGTQWEPLAVTLPDLSNYSTTTQMDTAIDAAKGLVLLNTTTLSAASSITINNVFSSSYTNYRIINNTNGGVLYLQLSLSGTANTSSYGYSAHYVDWNANHGVWYNNAGSATAAPFTSSYGSADIYNPAIATTTVFQGLGGDGATNGNFGGKHSVSTAYDGIKIYPGSGTMTGTIQIYGYKK